MRSQHPLEFMTRIIVLTLLLAACASATTPSVAPVVMDDIQELIERDPDVPELPFPDNPDPTQCGIPVRWGKDDPAWLTGYYEGEMVQPAVFFYDSHLRYSVVGSAPSGTEVRIVLYQSNPTLDYYQVETIDLDPPQTGWVPAPFLTFEPPE
jgi:hypothetical protein